MSIVPVHFTGTNIKLVADLPISSVSVDLLRDRRTVKVGVAIPDGRFVNEEYEYKTEEALFQNLNNFFDVLERSYGFIPKNPLPPWSFVSRNRCEKHGTPKTIRFANFLFLGAGTIFECQDCKRENEEWFRRNLKSPLATR